MSHINVGVLRGGPTDEYDVSLEDRSAYFEHAECRTSFKYI